MVADEESQAQFLIIGQVSKRYATMMQGRGSEGEPPGPQPNCLWHF